MSSNVYCETIAFAFVFTSRTVLLVVKSGWVQLSFGTENSSFTQLLKKSAIVNKNIDL